MKKVFIFNKSSRRPWQTWEDTTVMVSNRNGKDVQIFCKASEVQIGDNVWEHNIVQEIDSVDEKLDGVKWHY